MEKVDFMRQWCLIEYKTASDQHLAIQPVNGKAVGFSRTRGFDDFYQWLIVRVSENENSYWLFNKGAQAGAAELLTLPAAMTDFGQWKFTGEARQTFELRERGGAYYTLICKFNRQALSTRWNAPAFTWDQDETDDAQLVRFVAYEPISNVPALKEGDGNPGSHDLEQLKLESFDQAPVRETPRRLVGTALVAFPFVHDDWSLGERMRRSPYYLLKRECYWSLQDWRHYSGAGQRTTTITVYQGLSTTTENSLEKTFAVAIGSDGTYKSSDEVGLKFALSAGSTWKESKQVTREEYAEHTQTVAFPEGKRVAVAVWRLVNVYTLIRADGQQISQATYTEPQYEQERSWPVEGSSQITRSAA
jgi:hypothetical protein